MTNCILSYGFISIQCITQESVCFHYYRVQYARALKEKGVEVKVLMFPEDTHALDR